MDAVASPRVRVELGTPISTPSTGAYEQNTEEDDRETESSTSTCLDFWFMPDYFSIESNQLTTNQATEALDPESEAVLLLASPSFVFPSPTVCTHQERPLGSPTRSVKRKDRDFSSSADESGAWSSGYASSNYTSSSLFNEPGSPLPKRVRELKESPDPAVDEVQFFDPLCLGYPFCVHLPIHTEDTSLRVQSEGSMNVLPFYYGWQGSEEALPEMDSDMGYFPRGHLSSET